MVLLDPSNILLTYIKAALEALNREFKDVFNTDLKGYNGNAGYFQAVINKGPIQPPERKGRLPQYATIRLNELQQNFDELESLGVFARSEDLGIMAEYRNPSFLVKKTNGNYRLVIAFAEVGRCSKPQPALMPDVNYTANRTMEVYNHYEPHEGLYQIPLSRNSMKYCAVVTSFRGVRVYTKSAMSMPATRIIK